VISKGEANGSAKANPTNGTPTHADISDDVIIRAVKKVIDTTGDNTQLTVFLCSQRANPGCCLVETSLLLCALQVISITAQIATELGCDVSHKKKFIKKTAIEVRISFGTFSDSFSTIILLVCACHCFSDCLVIAISP
jgi:predicted RNase H-related nuclease YkuK (DUF458 family)